MSRVFVFFLVLCTSLSYAQNETTKPERDPTRPLGYQSVSGKGGKAKAAALRLSSVLISAQRKLAIINGQSLREGQSIPGSNAMLVSIHTQGVWVEESGRRWELRLAPSVIKKN